VPEEFNESPELALATNEGRCRHRKANVPEAPERWVTAITELKNALRRSQVLEAMLAEVLQVGVEERGGRGGNENLPAVAACRNTSRTVNIGAHVALIAHERGPCVHADPHLNRAGGKALVNCLRGFNRTRRGRESKEEGISLRVHLSPSETAAGLSYDGAVICEGCPVCLRAELFEQPCRTLDISEEKGHRSGRKTAAHQVMMGHRASRVTVWRCDSASQV
jgi:hypothetical protein